MSRIPARLSHPRGASVVARVPHSGVEESILSWSLSGGLRLWSMASGELLRFRRTIDHQAFAFCPLRGNYALAADDRIFLCSLENDEVLREWREPDGRVSALALSPDGRCLASAGEGKVARLWPTDSDSVAHLYRGSRAKLRSLAFSPSGNWLASAGDKVVRIYRPEEERPAHELTGHSQPVTQIGFLNEEQVWSETDYGAERRLWNVGNGPVTANRYVLRPRGGARWLVDDRWEAEIIVPGAPLLLTRGSRIVLLDEQPRSFPLSHEGRIVSVQQTAAGIFSCAANAILWKNGQEFRADEGQLRQASLSPDRSLWASFQVGGLTVRRRDGQQVLQDSDTHKLHQGDLVFSPDSTRLLARSPGTGSTRPRWACYDLLSARLLWSSHEEWYGEGQVRFAADGRHLWWVSPQALTMIDPECGKIVARTALEGNNFAPQDGVISRDGSRVARYFGDGKLLHWKLPEASSSVVPLASRGLLALSSDGRRLGVAGFNELFVVDCEANQVVQTLPLQEVTALNWDGPALVAGHADGSLTILSQ